jgi:hypothetical protein
MPTILEGETAFAPTCIACHDPQTEMTKGTGGNDPMLRLKSKPLALLGGFKTGNVVRLRLKKTGTFAKGYTPNFSEEMYTISSIVKAAPTFMYHLVDAEGDHIAGSYYSYDLMHVFENV